MSQNRINQNNIYVRITYEVWCQKHRTARLPFCSQNEKRDLYAMGIVQNSWDKVDFVDEWRQSRRRQQWRGGCDTERWRMGIKRWCECFLHTNRAVGPCSTEDRRHEQHDVMDSWLSCFPSEHTRGEHDDQTTRPTHSKQIYIFVRKLMSSAW